MSATLEAENICASVLSFLEASAAISTVPKSRWVVGGGRDLETKALTDWIELKVIQTLGQSSRGSKECSVLLQLDIYVRPGADIFRRQEIADAFGIALANASISVLDHKGADLGTTLGNLRLYDAGYQDLGKIDGLWTGATTIDGYFTPA